MIRMSGQCVPGGACWPSSPRCWWLCSRGAQRAAANAPPAALPESRPSTIRWRYPDFWDPRRRPERPDLSRISIIRFLTETDYPPFNYAGADGAPAGFNVDLARLICEEIKVRLHRPACAATTR